MPKLVLPDKSAFAYFSNRLVNWGFSIIPDKEFADKYKALGLIAPRPREGGREVGFVFNANNLTVTVWTTWLSKEQRPRKIDEAWVIITSEKNKILYSSHPIHRTKNFVHTLLKQAWIAKFRVKNRPCCPKCGKFMEIAPGKGAKSRYWRCSNKSEHDNGKNTRLGWDYGLIIEAKKYLKSLRKGRAVYREKRRKLGLPVDVARKKRKLWKSQKGKSP